MLDRTASAAGFVVSASLALVACGGEDVAPSPGAWSYSEFHASKNTCNYDGVISNGDGAFALTAKGGAAYEISTADGTAPFACTLDGDTLSCPDRAKTTSQLSANATLGIAVDAEANVDDADHMTGTQNGTVTCEGSDCAAAAALVGATLPCEFSVDFTATHTGD